MNEISNVLERLKRRAMEDKDALAILSFGSYARGEKHSDVDLCLILIPKRYDELYLSRKKLEYLTLAGEGFDVQVFDQLPIYIKIRALREGKIEFCKDESALYELALRTVREFEQFEPVYLNYLGAVAGAR